MNGLIDLCCRYAFSHIDFHFGSDSSQGSEHAVDGDHFPLEMALVFYDGQFKSMTEVRLSENSDALAVISFLFEVEYNIGNGQLSDVTGSAHVMGRYLSNAIVSDKSK